MHCHFVIIITVPKEAQLGPTSCGSSVSKYISW